MQKEIVVPAPAVMSSYTWSSLRTKRGTEMIPAKKKMETDRMMAFKESFT